MENKKYLPMMGVGPIYGAVIIAVTVIAVIAGKSTAFEAGGVNRCIPWIPKGNGGKETQI